MIRKTFLVVVSALIIFLSFLQHSFALYSWVDEQGVAHITDYPKPGPAPLEKKQEGAQPLPSSAGQSSLEVKSGRPAEPTAPVPMQQSGQEAAYAATKSVQAAPTPDIPATNGEATPAPSMPKTAPPPNAVAALVAGFLTVFLYIVVGLYLYGCLCLYLIAKKLNVPAAWTAWIPILQIWAFFASAKQPLWMVLFFIIPFVNVIVATYLWICIVENLGRHKMLGLLMLVPVVNLIFLGFLAFSNEESTPAPRPAGAF